MDVLLKATKRAVNVTAHFYRKWLLSIALWSGLFAHNPERILPFSGVLQKLAWWCEENRTNSRHFFAETVNIALHIA